VVGEPDDIEVLDFTFDEVNLDHLAAHGVRASDVYSVLHGSPRFFRDLPDRAATHVMIGEDNTGRFFYIAISPTMSSGFWRPITGWTLTRRRGLQLCERQ
jgi:hypothetical protein